MGRPHATVGKQGGDAMNRGRIAESMRARPYRALTVEDLKVLLDGHDPSSPVLLRDGSGGLLALNEIEARLVPRRGALPGSPPAGTEAAVNAIVLASPPADAVHTVPAGDLLGRLVSLISIVWWRIGAYGAGNIQRQFHRLDCEDD